MKGNGAKDYKNANRKKESFKEQRSKFTSDLLSIDKEPVKMIIRLLTGHCRLERDMYSAALAEDAIRFCKED